MITCIVDDILDSHRIEAFETTGARWAGPAMRGLAALTLAMLAACSQPGGGRADCAGTLITVPAGSGGQGATVPQLMAHASAMGLSQQDAETLIYLEGISPQATLEPGRTICLDGKPD